VSLLTGFLFPNKSGTAGLEFTAALAVPGSLGLVHGRTSTCAGAAVGAQPRSREDPPAVLPASPSMVLFSRYPIRSFMYLEMFLAYWRAASTPPSQRCSITSTSSAGGRPAVGRGRGWGEKEETHAECLSPKCALQAPSSSQEHWNSWENPRTAWRAPASPVSFQRKAPCSCASIVLCWGPASPPVPAALLPCLSQAALRGSEPQQRRGRRRLVPAGLLSRAPHHPKPHAQTLPAHLCRSFARPEARWPLRPRRSPRRGSPWSLGTGRGKGLIRAGEGEQLEGLAADGDAEIRRCRSLSAAAGSCCAQPAAPEEGQELTGALLERCLALGTHQTGAEPRGATRAAFCPC